MFFEDQESGKALSAQTQPGVLCVLCCLEGLKDLLGEERSWTVIPNLGTFALFYSMDFVKCLLASLETVRIFFSSALLSHGVTMGKLSLLPPLILVTLSLHAHLP